MTLLKPVTVRRDSITDLVYDAIRTAITSRELAPGERVVEAALAERLSVSKTPVREALLRLGQVGLVEPDEAGRMCVVVGSASAIAEAYEVRTALEVEAARRAAVRADAASATRIARLAARSLTAATAGRTADFQSADRAFHTEIAVASGNARLSRSVLDALDLVGTLRAREELDLHNSEKCGRLHVAIADQIRDHAPDRAGELMREHLDDVAATVAEALNATD